MYNKIYDFYDKKHFGARIVIYEGPENYLVISTDREYQTYDFLDKDLKKRYPADSYMKSIGFVYDIEKRQEILDITFDMDFEYYGYATCEDFYIDIIKNNKNPLEEISAVNKRQKTILIVAVCAIILLVIFFHIAMYAMVYTIA